MAEDMGKIEKGKMPGETVYKQVAPAGVAAEVTSQLPASPETVAALGRFLTEKLGADPALRERVATLSGVPLLDLTALMNGHPPFPLEPERIQQIATALVETQAIGQTGEIWDALGPEAGASEYLLPPTQVVQAMSEN